MGFITEYLGQRAFYIRILELEPYSESEAGRLESAPDIYGMFLSVFRLDLNRRPLVKHLRHTGEHRRA